MNRKIVFPPPSFVKQKPLSDHLGELDNLVLIVLASVYKQDRQGIKPCAYTIDGVICT
jgi:hypothetical protein